MALLDIISAQELALEDRKKLHEILRVAYALTEVEVWGENYVRITFEDYNELIEKGEILAARLEDEVVGGVHYYERRSGVFCFSLLCADFSKSGNGIGRALITAVEDIARERGGHAIELEILRPRGIEVPFKVRIADWYKSMGYQYTHSQDFREIKPIKARNLVNVCDFDYYWRDL